MKSLLRFAMPHCAFAGTATAQHNFSARPFFITPGQEDSRVYCSCEDSRFCCCTCTCARNMYVRNEPFYVRLPQPNLRPQPPDHSRREPRHSDTTSRDKHATRQQMRFSMTAAILCSLVHVAYPRSTNTDPSAADAFSGNFSQPTQECCLGAPEAADTLPAGRLYSACGANGGANFNPLRHTTQCTTEAATQANLLARGV